MGLKIAGSVFVIASTTLFGYLAGREKRNRCLQLQQLKRLFYLLRGEIQYGCTPLPEAVRNLGEKSKTVFSSFFISVSEKLSDFQGNSFYSIWKEEIGEQLKKTSLTKADKEKLATFGENLGYLNQEMQIKNIELFIEGLEDDIRTELMTQKEKIRLYQLLGVLSGIFITIVML